MVAFHNLGSEIGLADVSRALARVALFAGSAPIVGTRADDSRRYDSGGAPTFAPDAIDAYARHIDAQAIEILRRDGFVMPRAAIADAIRADALTGGAGGFPRDFEYIRRRVLEERRKPLNAFRLFSSATEVPLGAIEHTARRMIGTGQATIYRGSAEFSRARMAWIEETFGVAYVTCAVDTNFFQTLTTDWRGIRQYQADLRMAFRAVEEKLNEIAWKGDVASRINGVLNYPHGHVKVIPTAFTSSSSSASIVAALHALVDAPLVYSGGIYQPNRLVVSPRLHRFLFNTQFSAASDTSIARYFLQGQDEVSGIKSIDMAQELQGAGPAGANQDGILAYNDSQDSVEHVLIQPPTTLPVFQASPLDSTTVVFACTGGIVEQDSGNNIVGWATAA